MAVFPSKSGGAIQFWSALAPTAVWRLPVVLLKSAIAGGRVVRAAGIAKKRADPSGGVLTTVGVEKSELAPTAVLNTPVVLVNSANAVSGVVCPVVLLKSAATPTAVLLSAGVVRNTPAPTPVL